MPPVATVTSYGTEDVRQATAELGVARVLAKPIHASQLLDVVVELCSGERPAEAVAGDGVWPQLRDLSVMLVEDNAINRDIAVELLTNAGVRVTTAAHGQEALDNLAMLGASSFDVILMDLQMPQMGGLEATQRLRLAGCRTRIIAMTANAMEGDRELCLGAGMDGYISKPIKTDDLYTLLHCLPDNPAKPRAEETDAFDYVRALATADPEIVEVITPLFLEDYAGDLEKLQQAVAAGDSKTGCRQAHTLRSIVGNFNAEPAVQEARAVENALHRGDIETARALLPSLCSSITTLAAVLQDHTKAHAQART